MTTKLSVNINKIATLRNSRGGDVPNLIKFAKEGINCLSKALIFFNAKGVDWLKLLKNLHSDLHKVAMYQGLSENLFITDASTEEYKRKIEYLSNKFSPQEIQVFCEIIIKSIKDLEFNPTEQTGFEIAILRMYAFRIDEGEIWFGLGQ